VSLPPVRPSGHAPAWALALLTALSASGLVACAGLAPLPEAGPPPDLAVQANSIDGVSVSVAVLDDLQAQARYGVDLASQDLQAVWLRIENRSPQRLWLLVAALDPDYYSADEAAYMFRSAVRPADMDALRQRFRDATIPYMLEPGSLNEGHLIVSRAEGGRYVNVELAGHERLLRFGFAVVLPDGDFDYERLQVDRIYADQPPRDLGEEALRAWLEALPCCTHDADGAEEGDPLNVVIIGDRDQLLTAVARSGWSFTHRITLRTIQREIGAAIANSEYAVAPVSSLYAFGRKQDLALQRARSSIAQRNHMRLWLAPVTFNGAPVWVGQVSRDIGVKFTDKSVTFTTHVIDPAVDEAREYLLQSLLTRESVERFGFVQAMDPATISRPRLNMTDDPYFTDGLRLVVLLADEPVPPERARNLHWEEAEGPIAPQQAGSDTR
jgi:hypothetical protein